MALVSDPEVLFLDEPTLGLDPQARRAMWEHIAALKDDTTIVLTTHYLEEADALADRIGIIDEGKLIALGAPDELKRSISDGEPMVLELEPLSPQAIEAVRSVYPSATAVDGLIEIRNVDVDLFAIQDVLRPLKVAVKSSTRKTVTLDDVFIHLTGKQLRE